jgi:hypothetical protein
MRKSIVVAALAMGVGVTIGSMHAQAPAIYASQFMRQIYASDGTGTLKKELLKSTSPV